MNNKVLILTGSYGGGHNTATNHLKYFYEKKGYEVKTLDILEHINKFLGETTKRIYESQPKIWKLFFFNREFNDF